MSVDNGKAWTFDTVAGEYEKMRPEYPSELYADIFKAKRIDKSCSALEIGIGGGQATLPILTTGCKVASVECGWNLAALCAEKFKDYPNFSVINTKFEEFEGEKNSYDLIYSASAFHWIDEETGYEKVFEMLKSGGVFARFANHPYKDKGRQRLSEAIQKLYAVYMPGALAAGEYAAEDAERCAQIAAKYGFTGVDYRLYHRVRSFSAKEYTRLLNTYSDHISLSDELKREFYAKIEETINAFGGRIDIYDTIDLETATKP